MCSQGDPKKSRWIYLGAALLAAAAIIAYANSFHGAFLFDDTSIVEDAGIRRLWPITEVMRGPRPVVQVTLAVNYALGGLDVVGYHAFNLLVHLLAGLTLFGLVRRTLLSDPLRARFGVHATGLALVVALLWTVHPIQTESVTYIVQRAESLMGLFYLLTLYGAVRRLDSDRPWLWSGCAVAACAFGMACKPVMVTAPLMVILYERIFRTRSWREQFRRSGAFYAALAATWLLLGGILLMTESGPTAGFGMIGVTPWQYALTEAQVLLHYLRLSFWPSGLCLSYRWPMAIGLADVWPQALALGVLLLAVGWALWRKPALGFLGAWFFIILAPTSSFMPIADACFEHRMYLSLAAVVALVVLAIYALVWKVFKGTETGRHGWIGAGLAIVTAGLLTGLTLARNRDYRSEIAIWSDVVAKQPENAGAHLNLGCALMNAEKYEEASGELTAASQLSPDSPRIYYVLGNLRCRQGQPTDAVPLFESALRLHPGYANAHNNLGLLLLQLGRSEDALPHLREAARLNPGKEQFHLTLAVALRNAGKIEEVAPELEAALRLNPANPQTHFRLGEILAGQQRFSEAAAHFQEALRLNPDYADAQRALDGLSRR